MFEEADCLTELMTYVDMTIAIPLEKGGSPLEAAIFSVWKSH
jgi:hypothetical protein